MLNIKSLCYFPNEINEEGARYTAAEISGQPELWKEVYYDILSKKEQIIRFLSSVLNLKDLRIILTGAGSSAFIGESIQGILQKDTQRITQAIATTDLVTHPELFFLESTPTLLISFARSGNSPESLEAIKLADFYCREIFHLVITCNENGQVMQYAKGSNFYSFILPQAANDKGLAMTGSFTSMLLAIALIGKIHKIQFLRTALNLLVNNAVVLMETYLPFIKNVANRAFERVIFLGSGPLLGIARECHLKLQELTDGHVICKHDSFLGFRHGPRAVVNKGSLIVYLFSNDNHVFQYEKDLAMSIAADSDFLPSISFGRKIPGLKNSILDIEFDQTSSNEFYFITGALLGQLIGFFKSINLGGQPDNPSASGSISRVVQGVTIYPIESNANESKNVC